MDGALPFLDEVAWRTYVRYRRELGSHPIPLTWGYCLTAHKAQGSEFDDVFVYLDDMPWFFCRPSTLPDGRKVPFWSRWLYTAVTRAKKTCTLALSSRLCS